MSVVGVGVDLVHVPSFVDQISMPGSTISGVFTPGERRDAQDRPESLPGNGPARHLAARWAAKEAVIKAWSASIRGEPPVAGEHVHQMIEVVLDAWNRPGIRLHGVAAESLRDHDVEVSLSYDADYAIAFATLSNPEAGS